MKIPAFIAALMLGGVAAADPLDITGETENIIVKCPGSVTLRMPVTYPQDETNAPSITRQSGGAVVNPGGYAENGGHYWPTTADVVLPSVSRDARVLSEHPTNGTRVYELSCAYGFTVKNQSGYVTDTHRLTTVARSVRTRGECRPNSADGNFICEPGFVPPEQKAVKKFQKGLDELIQKVDPD